MRQIFFISAFIFLFGFPQAVQSQTAPVKLWDKTLGGIYNDFLSCLTQTSDGGYILVGYSFSIISGDKSEDPKGGFDFWVLKVDANGNKQWDNTLGGNAFDQAVSVIQTSDGGYLVGGYSFSPVSFDKSQPNRGPANTSDFWVIKLDNLGNKVWDKTIGGDDLDGFSSIQQTPDGGYIIGGTSQSDLSGDKSQPSFFSEYWLVKLDANGNKSWDKTYQGHYWDFLNAIDHTSDGGYILAGESESGVGYDKSQPIQGYSDYWIIKIDSVGQKIWDKTYGGVLNEHLKAIQQTSDGGYIVGGSSPSPLSGDKSEESKGSFDFWVLKLDANGNKVWDKTFGGINNDNLNSLEQTKDGGYILGGTSESSISGDKTEVNRGRTDYWIVKIDGNGNKIWDKTLGSSDIDDFSNIQQTADEGYILGGSSESGVNSDKSQPTIGFSDYWLIKLAAPCSSLSATLSATCSSNPTVNLNITGIQPGSSGTPSWTLTYLFNGVIQTVSGTSTSFALAQNVPLGSVFSLVSIVSGSCSKKLNQTVTIKAVPAPVTISSNICGPGSATLTATGATNGEKYAWYNIPAGGQPLFTDTTGTFKTPFLNSSTTYYVAIINAFGCEGPRTAALANISNLIVNAGPDEEVCVNDLPIQLSGFSPAGGIWSGAGVNTTGIFTPGNSLTGTQILTYTISENGCSASVSKQVTVLNPAFLGADLQTCIGEEIELRPGGTGTYLWSNGSTNATLNVKQSGTYWVKVTQNNCTVTDTIQVNFMSCPSLIPNIITLNGDGKNDVLSLKNLPKGKWQVQIYSRWGTLIYKSENYQNDWPTYNQSDGVFYYLIKNVETGFRLKGTLDVLH